MLSDEALVGVDRSELVEIAQQVYDQELRNRRLDRLTERSARPKHEDEPLDELGREEGAEFECKFESEIGGPEPSWLAEAACAITFDTFPGHQTSG